MSEIDNYPGVPGLLCPECNKFIPISVSQILSSDKIFCPNCGYILKLDKNNSENENI